VEQEQPSRLGLRRPRILWIVLAALLFVSLVPIVLLQRRVLTLSEATVIDNERSQQNEVTRLVAAEVQLYESNLRRQLLGVRQVLELSGLVRDVSDPKNARQVTTLLENFTGSNPDILYATAIGKSAKGPGAGKIRADADPFIGKELQRAFTTSIQRSPFNSRPLAHGKENNPAIVLAIPLQTGDEFAGMIAAVVSLDRVVERLREVSQGGRDVYVVDREGRIIAHPESRRFLPGTEVTTQFSIVARVKEIAPERRATETQYFTLDYENRSVEAIGTYSTIPELQWAVIAQRSKENALEVARLTELRRDARIFASVAVFMALALGYLFAVGITAPIHGLAETTKAISRGEFHERAPVRGAAEISELAATFNKMADDIGQYVEQLKQAAEENRELFVGSIRMIAAAIDEKDPYTRGHSARVAKYSSIIGEHMGLTAGELDRLRISALLHDVGKIGVDDRVLKKPGSLTPEEFELMKQHPVKGANIMRPVAQLKEMLPGIELHHEHIDGRGYPYGLKGDQIPMVARIIAVADTLDAMTTNRPYQTAMDLNFALNRIRQLTGSKFDPQVVDALEAAIHAGKLKLTATLVEV
jgi:HD-GYP domain-containing protein (c-di-GMP phosphodiesterase class II)